MAWETACRAAPTIAQPWVAMGEALFHQGEKEKAAECMREGLKRNGNLPEVRVNYGIVLQNVNPPRHEEAIEQLVTDGYSLAYGARFLKRFIDEHIKLQFDLMALAFQADITRVGTLLFARDLTGRTYPASEAPTVGFHGVSHHGEDPRRIAELAKINVYHVKMIAHLVDRLAKTEDGDGTLLDRSLVLYGSNMGNSNQHVHYDVPHVLIGGANGKMKGGRKETNAELNVVPMVDMMTMLVIFLLQQFSSTGEVLYMQKDIKLPDAQHGQMIEIAPVVAISSQQVVVTGVKVADIPDLDRDSGYLNIPALEERLRDEKKRWEFIHKQDPSSKWDGVVNIQADKAVPFRIVKRVMYSCGVAGYFSVNFAALDASATGTGGPAVPAGT